MQSFIMPAPKPQFFGANGLPLVGGKLYTYTAGTTVPRLTYSDAASTIPQTNPIVLNARGEPSTAIFWSGSYYVELRDASDNLIYSVDNFQTASSAQVDLGAGSTIAESPADNDNSLKVASTAYTYKNYVSQGSGIGQLNTAKIKIGFDGAGKIKATFDTTDVGNIACSNYDAIFAVRQNFNAGLTVNLGDTIINARRGFVAASYVNNSTGYKFNIFVADDNCLEIWNDLSTVRLFRLDSGGNLTVRDIVLTG